MNFIDQQKVYFALLHNYLNDVAKKGTLPGSRLMEAMRYSLLGGGKRIRPCLALAVCEMFGGQPSQALPFAAAVEAIHTYSLMHDDLPCMDNDDMRRGNLACHKKFDEATAILAGDALNTFAFNIIVQSSLSDKVVREAIHILSENALNMVTGQMIDVSYKEYDLETLLYMFSKKTSAIINAAVSLGALAAGQPPSVLLAFSQKIGMAFQIQDDIQDAKDAKNTTAACANIVNLIGVEASGRLLESCITRAINELQQYGTKAEFLISLTKYIAKLAGCDSSY